MKEDQNRHFDTGAQRDTADGKLRMSLIPQRELERVMRRYLNGAEKYGENNWTKGMPLSVYYDCAHRHLSAWWNGEDDEEDLSYESNNIHKFARNYEGIIWNSNKNRLEQRNMN